MLLAAVQLDSHTVRVSGLRVVTKAFHAFCDLDKGAELGHAQNFAVHYVADAMRVEERLPGVWLKLLDAERQTPLFRLDPQHRRFAFFALLQAFRRILDAVGPE